MKKRKREDNQKAASDKTCKRMWICAACILAGLILIVTMICILIKPASEPENVESNSEDRVTEAASEGVMTVYGEITEEALLENLQSSIVKIEAEVADGSNEMFTIAGSGVIINITETYVDIVTAHHVVELTATPQVFFYDGSCVTGSVLAYGKQSDIAFVRVDKALLSSDVKQAICGDNDDYNALVLQEDVYLIGSSVAVAGDVVIGQVKEKDRFVELFQNEMLLCDAGVYNGMSGGGVFKTDGKLMGIIVGTDDVDTVNVAITDVMAEYRSISE